MSKKVKQLRTRADFRRMVSWELSEVKERVVKKKKKRKRSQVNDGQLLESTTKDVTLVSNEDDEILSSEEESFYSAPESPLSSDETTSPVVTTVPPLGAVDSVALPESVTKHGSQSKRKKKQKAKLRKVAREEFFRPICELFEDEDSVLAVSDLSLSDMGIVLSLTELCLIKMKQVVKTHSFEKDTIPYLIQLLLTQDGILRSTATVQMRWAEKNFATLEMFYNMRYIRQYPNTSPCAVWPERFWPTYRSHRSYGMPDREDHDAVLHCPIPQLLLCDTYICNEECPMGILRILLHFCDFLFPLFGATGSGLDKVSSQMPAVYRVNQFLKTRYPKIIKGCAEGELKLWPAYVCWARGHVRQATDLFMEAASTLKDKCDKAICLNELGRMMSWYGDRVYSGTFFRKSLDTVLDMLKDDAVMKERKLENFHPKLVQSSAYAMMASAWDVGMMDKGSARGARLSWQAVLKEYATVGDRDIQGNIWYFHEAAMESQLCFHSTQPVENTDPSANERIGTVSEWLMDCEQFAIQHAPDHPVLYYHLSLISALAKQLVKSRKNFNHYLSNFVDHQGWSGTQIPGNPLGLLDVPNLPRIPWEALINLIPQDMPTAPVLPLCWRTRLLHPLYPYYNSKGVSYLADHCSEQINLHFTEDGYLTGDMSMDFPPMRCVLLDPFTGKVCFSQNSALAHYSDQFYHPANYPAKLATPQPLRLLKTEWCSVELVAGHSYDFSMTGCGMSRCPSYCFHTMLHWYGSDGTHAKLDIRKIIRKCVKDSLVSFFHTEDGPLEHEIERVETVIDKGLVICWHNITGTRSLEKIIKYPYGKIRNIEIADFYLHMTQHCIIGDSTIFMVFQLDSEIEQPDNVLVFVPCSSVDSFMNPVVHYSVDNYDIRIPNFKNMSFYRDNHLPHIRHVYTISAVLRRPPFNKWSVIVSARNQELVRHQIFDEYGKVVFSKEVKDNPGNTVLKRYKNINSFYDAIVGGRLYKCRDGGSMTSVVECWSLSTIDQSPDAAFTLQDLGTHPCIYPLPGCLIVPTSTGIYVLDPVTLTPIPCKMLQTGDTDSHSEDGDGIPRPQFDVGNCTLTILSVFNINWSSNKDKQNTSGCLSLASANAVNSQSNFSYVAMALNYRLIVMKVMMSELMILIDVELPGMITEFHDTGGNGYLVASSVFHNRQREDVYWLSREGRLLGVIPCLGSGPHSFCTKFLEHKSSGEDDEDCFGTYTFFNDGYGGISSIKLIPPYAQ